MFTTDESPARVTASLAASTALVDLAARRGDVTILLTDDRARILPPGQDAPRGTVRLGRLGPDDRIICVADSAAHTAWWRNRARIDLLNPGGIEPRITFDLTELTESEVYAAIAAGPLPRT